MNDMESRKFEDAFKDAFEGAEVSPGENVWTNIELDLEKAEGDKMKRRLLFYKLLAAASVTFAMCVAGVGYYYTQHNQSEQLAQVEESGTSSAKNEQPTTNTTTTTTTTPVDPLAKGAQPAPDNSVSASDRGDTNIASSRIERKEVTKRRNSTAQGNEVAGSNSVTSTAQGDEFIAQGSVRSVQGPSLALNSDESLRGATQASTLPSYIKPAYRMELKKEEYQPDPVALMMARLDQEEKELNEQAKKENKKSKEKLWTSVGFAAGAFNSSGSSVDAGQNFAAPQQNMLAYSNVADQQASASGVSYSMGVSVGTKLSERWVLQGGLNYMTQSSDYTTNAVATKDFEFFSAGSLNTANDASARLISSAPYNVNNNMQFISLPVQAGYLVVNNRVGVQLNAGLSTDLFLQNTLTPESDYIEKTTQGSGDASPYRTVNVSGLVGTEVSYKFGHHYRMALNPGLRYPLNSIYKSEYIEANPITFDIGLRFRYIFY
jgi:hypothetical protein